MHRVQRVPETESSAGSTPRRPPSPCCPRRTRSTSQIDEERDLRIDVYRSSGPGGQSVNTTDSAVRITHLPTGLVVAIQDEKSQHKNKAKAMAVLRARLLETRATQGARGGGRGAAASMVGTGDRSEKIRTYNFPQDRVTDHRIGMDLHNLPAVLDGDLDRLIDDADQTDQAERLATSARAMPPDPAAPDGADARSQRDEPAPGAPATNSTLGRRSRDAIARLRESGSDTARLDAELLAAHVLGIDRTTVIAHPEARVAPAHDARFEAAIARARAGEPVAYIRGIKEFHGLAFSVDERALIPRPETELLVDLGVARAALTILRKGRCRVVDVGTGSGAVCVALASALRGRGMLAAGELLATDVSPDALALATENAVVHGLADAIRFVQADLLPAGEPPADLLLANLPYVPSGDVAGLPVAARFEPRLALDGGPDGLAVVRRLLALLPDVLHDDGTALLEIGAGEADAVLAAARGELPGRGLVIHPDLAGIPRVLEVVAG